MIEGGTDCILLYLQENLSQSPSTRRLSLTSTPPSERAPVLRQMKVTIMSAAELNVSGAVVGMCV